MATVAEILANPARFSPDTLMRAALKKYKGNAKKVVAYFRSQGLAISPGDVARWLKGNVKRKPAKKGKRPAKKKTTARKAKKTKGRRPKASGKTRWKLTYPRRKKAKKKGAGEKALKLFGEGWADDNSAYADAEVGKRVKKHKRSTKKRKHTMAKKRKGKSRKVHAAKQAAQKLKGRKVRGRFTGKIGSRVGRRVGSGDVAMNPAFGGIASLFSNPALDLSLEGIGYNLWNGGQSAVGAVAGLAAAKYARDLLISKIIQKTSPKVTMVQRLLSGVATMVIAPPLIRAILPNKLGENLSRGIVTGAGLYIVSGIELGGKKLLPIGEMVGEDDQEIIIDSSVDAMYTAVPQAETAASPDQTISGDYTARERGEVQAYEDATEMQDTVSYPSVGDGVTEYSEEVF